MALHKLTSTDAFVVTDVPDAPATGVVRMGKKILQSSAKDLARSATYSFAAFGIERGGASAGINAEGEATKAALTAFTHDAKEFETIDFVPGKGVSANDLAALASAQPPELGSRALTVSGIVAAARWANDGDLDGASVVVEGQGKNPTADLVAAALTDAGASVLAPKPDAKPWAIWGSDVDLLLAGSKPGTLTHQGALAVKAKALIPWGPLPVTTKAYLMLERNGVTVVPDFVAAAGGLIGSYLPEVPAAAPEQAVRVASQITDVLSQCADHDEGVLMGACTRAETFLGNWTDFVPFGRPLAA